jgi:hypothetical protein
MSESPPVDTGQERPFGSTPSSRRIGPQRQSDSHSPRQTAEWGRSSADSCSAVPPTQQRRRVGKAAQIAAAIEERIDPVVFAGPADLWQPMSKRLPPLQHNQLKRRQRSSTAPS